MHCAIGNPPHIATLRGNQEPFLQKTSLIFVLITFSSVAEVVRFRLPSLNLFFSKYEQGAIFSNFISEYKYPARICFIGEVTSDMVEAAQVSAIFLIAARTMK